ncbi:hypothetical protein NIES2100_27340 [Calothrix sp. NIES-2100]|uniref:hypothetical protein n=1 Tax=Calothrix sp. NIES-2100 TaxID=1954172 RepID=UPI000B60285E|nr:hypothetical protein NIES2100_27340 [Calothrix sp. NIES-2100]
MKFLPNSIYISNFVETIKVKLIDDLLVQVTFSNGVKDIANWCLIISDLDISINSLFKKLKILSSSNVSVERVGVSFSV